MSPNGFLCALPLFLQAGDASASAASVPEEGVLLLFFRAAAVDGVDELVLRDGTASIEHLEWQPIEGLEVEVLAPLPSDEELSSMRIAVLAHEGRPRVQVVQHPSAENGRELRVRIDDGPDAGAAPLVFELWAVPAKRAPRPFDVVVITIDSLRADHLGCYGYERPTSPNLDAFARSALRYTNAFSTSSFTPPSHASLLTSRYVGDHGLLTWNELPDEQLSLAEILSTHGYRTGASVNLLMLSEQNLGQGFEWRREGEREAREIVSDALEFLRDHDDRPIFLWLHLYDVHRPYGRIRGWTNRFAAAPRPRIGHVEEHYNLRPEDVEAQGLSPEDLAHVVDRYDAGIAYADAQLGPLLAELSTPERLARTLVVLTADHGENLLEHPERLFSHDPFLFSTVTRVPLLLRHPGGGEAVVRDDLVSLIDLAPTVLTALGIGLPPTFSGKDLHELDAGARWNGREIYQECWGWTRLAAARNVDWLALCDLSTGAKSILSLVADPDELQPLAPDARRAALPLVERLDEFASRRPADEAPPELDEETLERLRALGYVDR